MGNGKTPALPDVPEPTPPPKPEQDVASAFARARSRTKSGPSRGLKGTDLTGGLLSKLNLGKKTLLGQ